MLLPPDLQEQLSQYEASAPKIHFSPKQKFYPPQLRSQLAEHWGPEDGPLPLPYIGATDQVYRQFGLPYPLYGYQQAWVDAFAPESAAGMYFEVGAGKTSTATVAALYHRMNHPGHTLVLMPPILIHQWYSWLKSVKGINSVLMYKGTPSERAKLDLNSEWVLMSMDIFKRDFQRLYDHYLDRHATLIVDEAVSVKNPTTQNHKCVWAFHNRDLRHIRPKSKKAAPLTKPVGVKSDPGAMAKLRALLKENI